MGTGQSYLVKSLAADSIFVKKPLYGEYLDYLDLGRIPTKFDSYIARGILEKEPYNA